jgi:hypothetical protein
MPLDQYWGRSDRTSLRSKCKDCAKQWHREHKLLTKYGLDRGDYDQMLAEQDGRCAICRALPKSSRNGLLHVDHCHQTGEVRGLLCFSCNTGLGAFQDSEERLVIAAEYLRRSA